MENPNNSNSRRKVVKPQQQNKQSVLVKRFDTMNRTSTDFAIKNLIQTLNRKTSIGNSSNNEESNAEESIYKAAIYVLAKTHRTLNENLILVNFLSNLAPLTRMLKEAVSDTNLEDLLKNISFVLRYLYAPKKNKILFKTGEKGDKFYLIIKGKVGVVMPKDERVELSIEEYFAYLLKLRKYREYELLNNCLNKNKNVYSIEDENFDEWIKAGVSEERISKIRFSPPVVKKGHKQSFICPIKNLTRPSVLADRKKAKLSRLKQSLSKEIEEAFDVIEKEDHDEINEEEEMVSINEYIDRIKPNQRHDSSQERQKVSIFTYNHIISLSDGDKFGDFALDSFDQKRSGTIIAIEPTHFGTMDKKSYNQCIKKVNEKVKKANLNFILSHPIFKEVHMNMFMKKYYNFFVLKKVIWREKLLNEGESADSIYIIREGEFDINMKKSIAEMNEVIKYLKNGDESHITENEREEKFKDSLEFSKFINEKKLARLAIINNSEIVGLTDCIYKDRYLFNVECISSRGEVFEIKRKIFLMLCNVDEAICKNTKIVEEKKIAHLAQRVQAIKKIRLRFYNSFKIGEEEKILLEESKIKKRTDEHNNLNTNYLNLGLTIKAKKHLIRTLNISKSPVGNKYHTTNTETDNNEIKEPLSTKNNTTSIKKLGFMKKKLTPLGGDWLHSLNASPQEYYEVSSTNGEISRVNPRNPFVKKKRQVDSISNSIRMTLLNESHGQSYIHDKAPVDEEINKLANSYQTTFDFNNTHTGNNIVIKDDTEIQPVNINTSLSNLHDIHSKNEKNAFSYVTKKNSHRLVENKISEEKEHNFYRPYDTNATGERYKTSLSKTFIQIPEKEYNRTVFDEIFRSYLTYNNFGPTESNQNSISVGKQCKSSYYSLQKSRVTNDSTVIEKNPKSVDKNNIDYDSGNANIVDCLVMDNFNRIYNTIYYYYSNVFNQNGKNFNSLPHTNRSVKSRPPLKISHRTDVKKENSLSKLNRTKLFETTSTLCNKKTKLHFNGNFNRNSTK